MDVQNHQLLCSMPDIFGDNINFEIFTVLGHKTNLADTIQPMNSLEGPFNIF